MFRHLQSGGCQPGLGKFIIDKITEIHGIGYSVGDEIQPEQNGLIGFFGIDDNRNKAQQNK